MKYKRIKRNEKRATPRTARDTSKSIATKDTLSERKKQNDPYNKTVKKRKLYNNTKGRLKEGAIL